MKACALLVSLAALAWADAAAAQQAVHVGATEGTGTALAPAALPSPPAPAPTDIRPDTGNLSLGTQVTQNGTVHTIDGGTRAGNNLFHSFSRFDLAQGDFARWVHSAGDPASIRNVVNRVTGGDPSHIFGTLDSTALPNADFYFINPAGIIFGDGARVNVPAAAHFSTAQELRFGAGAPFTVATPGGSTFSVAAPASFGFVGTQGDIAIVGTGALVAGGGDISFSAANLLIHRASIDAAGVQLAAVGDQAAAVPIGALPAAPLAGRVEISGETLAATRDGHDTQLIAHGAGGVRIAGGTVEVERAGITVAPEVDGSSGLSIHARHAIRLHEADLSIADAAAQAGPLVLSSGGKISIGPRTSVTSDSLVDLPGPITSGGILIEAPTIRILGEDGGSRLAIIGTASAGAGQAGDILIMGGTLEVRHAFLSAFSLAANAGTVAIDLTGSLLMDRAMIDTRTLGVAEGGSSGNVFIRAPSIRLVNGSLISNTSFGSSSPGSILLTGGEVELTDSEIKSDVGGLGCEPCGDVNDAGSITVNAGRLRLVSSNITADTRGAGFGGSILVTADQADIIRSSISSNAYADGPAGNVVLRGGSFRLDSGSIESRTMGLGKGGHIDIDVGELTATGSSRIVSNAGEDCLFSPCSAQTGDAGDIEIAANRLSLIGGDNGASLISSDTYGSGGAGTITLTVPEIILDNAVISSSTSGSGAGGRIMVAGDTLTMRTARLATNTEGPGAGGSISLALSRSLNMDDDARIASNSFRGESGAGGTITIAAPEIRVMNASRILTETFGRGDAGAIKISGGDLLVAGASTISSSTQGSGTGGSLAIDVDRVTISGSFVSADSGSGLEPGRPGVAGNVSIRADDRLTIRAEDVGGEMIQSVVSSETVTAADAGSVVLSAGELVIDHSVVSSETRGDGDAGTVLVDARTLTMRNGATISTTSRQVPGCQGCDETPTGNGGFIQVFVADATTVESGSQILSSTEAFGDAGEIYIDAGSLLLRGGRISTSASQSSTGRAGLITIVAPLLEILEAGSIESISRNGNQAGDIALNSAEVRLTGLLARISSSNEAPGTGDAGSVTIAARDITLAEGARIASSSASGAAGDIVMLMPEDGLLRLESRGLPSLLTTSSGPGTGGRIIIGSPRAIISNGGSILALGEEGGANVQLFPRYFIASADRANRIAVDGNFLLAAAAYDVSAGTVNRDLSVIDASGVLRGQCAAVRATGQVSQLVVRPIGPYGSRPAASVPANLAVAAAELRDGCP